MPAVNGSLKNVDTILFDLDGTLRFNRPSFVQIFCDYAVSLGVPDGVEKRRKAARWTHYYWAQSAELEMDSQQFDTQSDTYWTHYAQRSLLAFDCSEARAKELAPIVQQQISQEYKPQDYIPLDVPETLQELKLKGYRIGLLTNRTKPVIDYLQAIQLAGYFDLVLAAGEVNSWKPDPGIFHQAVLRLNSHPAQTIYIGDNYYADVIGARKADLVPVLLDPEHVFPDADCLVVESLSKLNGLLRS